MFLLYLFLLLEPRIWIPEDAIKQFLLMANFGQQGSGNIGARNDSQFCIVIAQDDFLVLRFR